MAEESKEKVKNEGDEVEVVGVAENETSEEQLDRMAVNLKEEGAELEDGELKRVPILSPDKEKMYRSPVYVVWNKTTGEIVAVWAIPLPQNIQVSEMGVYKVSFGWTKPDWETQTSYREECQEWQRDGQVSVTNRLRLHRMYLDNHLKEVEGLLDEEGEEIKLEFTKHGRLEEESYQKIAALDLSLVDLAINLYEKDILRTLF